MSHKTRDVNLFDGPAGYCRCSMPGARVNVSQTSHTIAACRMACTGSFQVGMNS